MGSPAAPRPGGALPRAFVDLEALTANARLAAGLAGGARVMAVVKADAYGHGAVPVARALEAVVDALAVARVEEGLALRRAGVGAPIVVLQGCLAPGEMAAATAHGLEVVVHRRDQLAELLGGAVPTAARVWIQVDTGMHRLGLAAADFRRACETVRRRWGEARLVAMSHLASADELDDDFTREQLARFRAATEGLAAERSLANSAGLLGWPETRFDWVRPGIMLYGVSPLKPSAAGKEGLKPVMRLTAEVIAVRRLAPGESVGYGRRFVCERPTRVATVAAGYGDGYPRHAPDGTPVAVAGRRTRLIGRVSMDSLAVDLTDLPRQVGVGSAVELWGGTVPVAEVAAACDTIPYELLARVASRVPRDYGG